MAKYRRSRTFDLIAEFDLTKWLSLLDLVRLENQLADLPNVPVDRFPANTLKEPVRQAVLALLGNPHYRCATSLGTVTE